MTDPTTDQAAYVPLGKLGKPHGLKGEIRFWPYNPDSDALQSGVALRCQLGEVCQSLTIERIRWRERFALIKFKSMHHKDQVAKWTNAECAVARSALPEIDDDEFYLVDLLELPVYGRMTEDEPLRVIGHIKGFVETGANDVIRVGLERGGDLLVPFVMGYAVEDVFVDEGLYLMPLEQWAIEGTQI